MTGKLAVRFALLCIFLPGSLGHAQDLEKIDWEDAFYATALGGKVTLDKKVREAAVALCNTDQKDLDHALILSAVHRNTMVDVSGENKFDANTPETIEQLLQFVTNRAAEGGARGAAIGVAAMSIDSSKEGLQLETRLWETFEKELDEHGKAEFLLGFIYAGDNGQMHNRLARIEKLFETDYPEPVRTAAILCVGRSTNNWLHLNSAVRFYSTVLQSHYPSRSEIHAMGVCMEEGSRLPQFEEKPRPKVDQPMPPNDGGPTKSE